MSDRISEKDNKQSYFILKVGLLGGFVFVLTYACLDFYNIASGTGTGLGNFSVKWALLFFGFMLMVLALAVVAGIVIWKPYWFETPFQKLQVLLKSIGKLRWLLIIVILLIPIWFLQYTYWGVVFSQPALRLLIWILQVVLLAFLLTPKPELSSLFSAVILTSGIFIIATNLRWVTSYPFALAWSEGNRLWDYSMLFGQGRYTIPVEQTTPPYLSLGRQLVGSLPFLWPGLTIAQERAWVGLLNVIPSILLGLAVYWKSKNRLPAWLLAGLWGLAFLYQGPIHPPLLLVALLVILAWGRSLWLSIPLLIISAYFAQMSRPTWVFAPAIWIASLELISADNRSKITDRDNLRRVLPLVLAGLTGSLLLPKLIALTQNKGAAGYAVTKSVANVLKEQPLLWYRLFPNATYDMGILIGLLVAVGPLIILLIYLTASRQWSLNKWQYLALWLPLLVFLAVGLVVSTKIGGGADLHNLDMFLIGVLFATAPAWRKGILPGSLYQPMPHLMKAVVLLALVIPGISPLMKLRPISFSDHISVLVTLTDLETPYANERDLRRIFDSLPPDDEVNKALLVLQDRVELARLQGEVLFIDQRQLLTFGYIKNVPLVTQYEKKYLMDQALSSNSTYFERFYSDLAAHRFALIVSDPLRTPVKDQEYAFGEENNAWVQWIARPVLCYYEPVETFEEMRLQLLVPKVDSVDCAAMLP